MKYDFDIIIDRRGTNSIKYDFARERGKPEDVLPMWVADMDFPAPPEVLDDVHKSVAHVIFGYTEPKDSYYDAVSDWFSSQFGYRPTKQETVATPGLVFAIAQAVHGLPTKSRNTYGSSPLYACTRVKTKWRRWQ